MDEDKRFQDRVTAYYERIQGMDESEKTFELFIESYLTSEEGGWTKATDAGLRSEDSRGMNLDIVTLTDFVKSTQPMAWRRFERMCIL